MSLSPWPVTVITTVCPAKDSPAARAWRRPATPAADAGSTKTPSRAARSRWAARICSSVTASKRPPDSSRAASASFHEAGLPMRMAVALRLRVGERHPGHQRRGTGGLEAAHHRTLGRAAEVDVLRVAQPVRRDVAGVADGQDVDVGSVAEEVDDLEGGGLLALEADGVDRVHERDGIVPGQLARHPQAVVEVAAHHDHLRAVHDRLRHLAGGDLALRHQHERLEAGPGGVRRHRRGGVAGGGAHHGLRRRRPRPPRSPWSCRGP